MLLPESYSQSQFDSPSQAGAIRTSAFTDCADGSLAVGGFKIFYEVLNGDFYNLYDRSWTTPCSLIFPNTIGLMACPSASYMGVVPARLARKG